MKRTVSLIVCLLVVGALMCTILVGQQKSMEHKDTPSKAQAQKSLDSADKEFRAVWLASVYNLDIPDKKGMTPDEQKAQIDNVFDEVASIGMNAVVVQVRPNGDALYHSDIFPWSEWVTGTQGEAPADSFDPLSYMVESAHARGLLFHAWVNPYRITAGSKTNVKHDVNALSDDNPAKVHPEYTVAYDDGCLYYNPGIPEVRQMIVDGVKEIVDRYDVDGIHMDDYFYPYKVYQEDELGQRVECVFEDNAAFAAYGEGKELDDWRRENVTSLVSEISNVTKNASHRVSFGISPFGIWANKTSNENGSDTNAGFESYYDMYADTRGWVKDGYLDYICPQDYWGIGNEAASFDTVASWWDDVVKGTDAALYIGHAAYKMGREETGFTDADQMKKQVEYARGLETYKGSIFYGYSAISENTFGVKDSLCALYAAENTASGDGDSPDVALADRDQGTGEISPGEGGARENSEGAGSVEKSKKDSTGNSEGAMTKDGEGSAGNNLLTLAFPGEGEALSGDGFFLAGTSDASLPLTLNGQQLERTKSGYFNAYLPLSEGDTVLSLQNGDQSLTRTVRRQEEESYADGVYLEDVSPSQKVVKTVGGKVPLRAYAPSGSVVYAVLGGEKVLLEESPRQGQEEGKRALFEGCYEKESLPNWGLYLAGAPIFYAEYQGEKTEKMGEGEVYFQSSSHVLTATVTAAEETPCLSSDGRYTNVWFPLSQGTRAYVCEERDGMTKLSNGMWVNSDRVETKVEGIEKKLIKSAVLKGEGTYTTLVLKGAGDALCTARAREGKVVLTLSGVDGERAPDLVWDGENPLFSSSKRLTGWKDAVYVLDLKGALYGYQAKKEGEDLLLSFRNPVSAKGGEKPLSGIAIALDAGHGGSDPGALGMEGEAGQSEADINLILAKSVKKKLEEKGAKVILTRNADEDIGLEERKERADEGDADLFVSLHQNSAPSFVDMSQRRGMEAYYFYPFSATLALHIENAWEGEIPKNGLYYQSLSVCRQANRPSVLIETSYMVNADDYEIIMDEGKREDIAEFITKGITSFFNQGAKSCAE